MLEDLPEEIIEEVPFVELSEELPDPEDNIIVEDYEPVEELPIEDVLPEEITEIPEGELLEEETENHELETVEDELLSQSEVDPTVTPSPEDDTNNYEEEILSKVTEITEAVKVIQANQKTGTENMILLSTCSFSILCMIFGGFVIHCFLNRLG